MREAWELLTAGPPDAERSVVLLPGGANAARSFNIVMAEPGLSGVRLVATTMPGMAGGPAPHGNCPPAPARARRAGHPRPGPSGRGAGRRTWVRRGRGLLPRRDSGPGDGAVRALPGPGGAARHQLDDRGRSGVLPR